MERVLHSFFRSSASYRVRIALGLKGLDVRQVPVHLNRAGGEQFTPGFRALNPQSLVPVYSEDDFHLGQSLAILEYLDERYPTPPLLPSTAEGRARARQLAFTIACDIHPLQNLRVLKYLKGPMALSDEAKNQWIAHWISLGLEALEAEVAPSSMRGAFCMGDTPTIADCCLVPQLANARRFETDLSPYPTLLAIDAACQALPAFRDAHPSAQADAE